MLLEVQCEVSTVMSSAVSVNTDIYQHSMRPSADQRYGDAEFIFQQAPAHTAKGTKAGSMTMCYCV